MPRTLHTTLNIFCVIRHEDREHHTTYVYELCSSVSYFRKSQNTSLHTNLKTPSARYTDHLRSVRLRPGRRITDSVCINFAD
jgi:hypothetical protein